MKNLFVTSVGNPAVQNICENFRTIGNANGIKFDRNLPSWLANERNKEDLKHAVMESFGNPSMLDKDESGAYRADYEAVAQLFENATSLILQESNIGAVSPQVALTFPLQFVNWMRNTMKNTVATIVPTSTEIVRQIKQKYLVDKAGTRYAVPQITSEELKHIKNEARIAVTKKQPANGKPKNLVVEAGGFLGKDSLSIEFYVESVVVTSSTDTFNGQLVTSGDNIIPAYKRITRTDRGLVAIPVVLADKTVLGEVMVKVDFKTGTFTAIPSVTATPSGGTLEFTHVMVKGFVSSESNLHTIEVDWETTTHAVSIPEGRHLNTNVTQEKLTDIQLFYNIDQTKEVTDQMIDAIELMKDDDILEYFDEAFADAVALGPKNGPIMEFSLTPREDYALSPVEWRSIMLKDYISRMAREMKKVLYCPGIISIVGNSSVTGLLQNVNWVWTEGQERAGVIAQDGFGFYDQDGMTFKVTSSDRIPDNKIRLYFLPADESKMTYTFYQHSTYITNKYLNPNNSVLPNIMVTDRYVCDKLFNVQGQVSVVGVSEIFKHPIIKE